MPAPLNSINAAKWPTITVGFLAVLVGLLLAFPSPGALAQVDTKAPTISSVAITSNPDENDADLGAYSIGRSGGIIVSSSNWASGVYRIGDGVQVTVTFSEGVTVTGSPHLELAIGSSNRTGEYESTDGSAVAFSYTVAEGDSDSNGIAISASKLTLNSGSIRDSANNDANLSHNALANQDDHKVDGVRPRISRLFLAASTGGSDGAYSEGEEMIIVAEFTEDHPRGSVAGPPQIRLDFDGEETLAPWDISLLFDSPRDYGIFGYVVEEGDLDSDGVAISANSIDLNGGFIRDPAGNDAILTHSAVAASSVFVVDAVAPTVSSIAITSDPGDDDIYGTGDKIEVTVTFSENMSLPASITCSPDVVHCKAELELDIGGTAKTADYQSHDGADVVYAYTVRAGDTDDNGISIGANKLTGQRIMDAGGRNGEGINDADLSHDAVADDAGHKVRTTQAQANTPATGSPVITGAAQLGETLRVRTTGIGDADGMINARFSYQWIRRDGTVDTDINGANSGSYTIVAADVGKTIKVRVSFTDDAGNPESLTSAPTGTVSATRNSPTTGAPSISGTAQVGQTLSVDTSGIDDADGLTNASYGGTWTAGGYLRALIGQGRDLSYTVSRRDVGLFLEISVNFRDDAGKSVILDSAPTGAVAPTSPAAPESFAVSQNSNGDLNLSWQEPEWDLVGEIRGDPTWGDGGSPITGYVVQWKKAADSWSRQADVSEATETGTAHTIEGLTNGVEYAMRVLAVNVVGRGSPSDEATATVDRPASTDASLSGLALSGVDFGTFDSETTSYTAQVANSVSQTTVTPTVNHSGASYVIKLGGVEDADGEISLEVGSNVITVEVTAEDDSTSRTYTVTVARAAPPSTDATLSALTLSGVDFGTFDSETTSYTAQVANSVSQTTVTPTVNHSGASYVIKLGGVTDADGVIALSVGSNVVTVVVTAEDGQTTRTYTVTVTRATSGDGSPTPPQASSDASLSDLTLSGVDFGTFASETTSYTAQVANSVSQTTVTPTVNHSGASYVVKLGGVEDADGEISLEVGSNVITVEVTAEDDSTSRTYTVTVARAAPPSTDATLSALTLSGVDFGTFDSETTSYTAQAANSVSQTTVTPTVNESGASYVVKLGGVVDDDGVVELSVGSNVITIEITAGDGQTTRTYTVTVGRESLLDRYDSNDDGGISRAEAIAAISDYFDGTITRLQAVEIIRLYFSSSQ